MFAKGDMIIHPIHGVCKVESVGMIKISGNNRERMYYTLLPEFKKDSKIYSPIDSDKLELRAVISKEVANRLIESIPDIKPFELEDEKEKERLYKEALHRGNCKEIMQIIKAINIGKESRNINGKKIAAIDKKYLNLFQEHIDGELAISLGIPKENVKSYITEVMKRTKGK